MKVLIISHNPITTYQSMGKTMLSLFKSLKKEEICQLYFQPNIPDIDFCDSYFRLTDKDVLQSYTRFLRARGTEIDKEQICPDNSLFENPADAVHYRPSSHFKRWLRDMMWRPTRWFSKELTEWLDRQQPTCVFVAPGDAVFTYRIALKIASRYDLPIVTYLCDDYCFLKHNANLFRSLRLRMIRRYTKKLMANTAEIIAICEEIGSSFSSVFKVPYTVIMTGAAEIKSAPRIAERIDTITYMGNLQCNRYMSLAEIGRALSQINKDRGTSYHLDVFTAEKDTRILSEFDGISALRLKGYLIGEAYKKAFDDASMFLHTEAFDRESIDLVKNSVSTKIADILGSGKPMIAYGPANIASVSHLIRHDCAIVITHPTLLKESLESALIDKGELRIKAQNALKTAAEYHADGDIKMRKVLERVSK